MKNLYDRKMSTTNSLPMLEATKENKGRRIILHDAIETVISTSDNLQKENEILKNYLAQQHLISDYIKYRRSNK